MNALVIFDSKFGNTELIARAISRTLEAEFTVRTQFIAERPAIPNGLDLLVVGEPTHAHGMSQSMLAFLAGLPDGTPHDVRVLAFDTRFRMHPILSGRAAPKIARMLQKHGARLLLPPESFFVLRSKGHPLEVAEEERAAVWTRAMMAQMATIA